MWLPVQRQDARMKVLYCMSRRDRRTTSSRLKSEAIGALPLRYRFVVVQWTKTTQMSFNTLLYIDILIFKVL